MRKNSFTNNMSKKSNEELEKIILEKSKYTNEALQAVIWELEDRNVIEIGEIVIEGVSNIDNEVLKEDKLEVDKNTTFEEFEVIPTLYSKSAILGFAIFFSPLFGSILLMLNLKVQNKIKERNNVIIFILSYTLLSYVVLNNYPKMVFLTLVFNVIGAILLIEYFWNKHLGRDLNYNKKSITKPLLISFMVLFFLVFIQFLPQMMGK